MLVCKVENLFGENYYRCGRMAEHVITVGETNYLPLMAVERLGFIYEPEDISGYGRCNGTTMGRICITTGDKT